MAREVYNSKNIFLLISIFAIIFSLLYAFASFLHKKQKIDAEISAIQTENKAFLAEIEDKKRQLEYLKTPQRIDKEAKIQIGKKQEGENVIVFIEENLQSFVEPQQKSDEDLFLEYEQDLTVSPYRAWFETLFVEPNDRAASN